MSLANWERNGWMTAHRSSPPEIQDLLAVVDRDLADSLAAGLSPDWRLNIAYNAALQAATAALAAAGYRASRDQHHYRVIQSLQHTLAVDGSVIHAFDAFRRKRNATGYERVGLVSETDALAMRELAQALREALLVWLRRHHPHLLRT